MDQDPKSTPVPHRRIPLLWKPIGAGGTRPQMPPRPQSQKILTLPYKNPYFPTFVFSSSCIKMGIWGEITRPYTQGGHHGGCIGISGGVSIWDLCWDLYWDLYWDWDLYGSFCWGFSWDLYWASVGVRFGVCVEFWGSVGVHLEVRNGIYVEIMLGFILGFI